MTTLKQSDQQEEMDIAAKKFLAGWKATGQPTNIKDPKKKASPQPRPLNETPR